MLQNPTLCTFKTQRSTKKKIKTEYEKHFYSYLKRFKKPLSVSSHISCLLAASNTALHPVAAHELHSEGLSH